MQSKSEHFVRRNSYSLNSHKSAYTGQRWVAKCKKAIEWPASVMHSNVTLSSAKHSLYYSYPKVQLAAAVCRKCERYVSRTRVGSKHIVRVIRWTQQQWRRGVRIHRRTSQTTAVRVREPKRDSRRQITFDDRLVPTARGRGTRGESLHPAPCPFDRL